MCLGVFLRVFISLGFHSTKVLVHLSSDLLAIWPAQSIYNIVFILVHTWDIDWPRPLGTLPKSAITIIILLFQVISPSGTEDDCFIQPIDGDDYSIRFMPRENGIHNIHIKFNGVHIPGSPLRIQVGKGEADPAAVHASGNGLTEIKSGRWNIN